MSATLDSGLGPAFLPLTLDAATSADTDDGITTSVIHRKAQAAEAAAIDCWTTLLAGCPGPGRLSLPGRLHELSEAVAVYLGRSCWYGAGSTHRHRITAAQS